jgi:citrate lyase beta subunit
MKILAKALIQTAAFLELSSDDAVNPDDAVRALEDIAHTLQSASPEELVVVRDALQELAAEERAGFARADVLKFYEHFFESIGVTV